MYELRSFILLGSEWCPRSTRWETYRNVFFPTIINNFLLKKKIFFFHLCRCTKTHRNSHALVLGKIVKQHSFKIYYRCIMPRINSHHGMDSIQLACTCSWERSIKVNVTHDLKTTGSCPFWASFYPSGNFWEQRCGNAGVRTRSILPGALIIIAFVCVHSFWFCI